MTYRIDRSQFIENGPAVSAARARARVRIAALYAAFEQRKCAVSAPALAEAA